ncbi:MAG: F0F1 ATP synthase subunit delta, partial [Sphingobacterium sp.]
MSVFKVASRYAKSLIDLSNEHQNLDVVKADMDGIVAVFKSNTELQAVLNNPIINTDRKIAILKALFEGKVAKEIIAFFTIVVNKGRAKIVYPTTLE